MMGSSEPSAAEQQETFAGSGLNAAGKLTLNAEQLQHLLSRISSDEQKELQDTLRQCTNEVTMSRGLPFTALTLGSLYVARTRLPAKYHFGPKGWPFYVIMGIGSFTAANVLGMGTCRERVQPRIAQLWQKYGGAESATNYAAIRSRNRGGAEAAGIVPEQQQPQRAADQHPHQSRPAVVDDTYAPRVRYGGQRPDAYSDTFISGTPSGPPRDRPYGQEHGSGSGSGGGEKTKTNAYGDVGFS